MNKDIYIYLNLLSREKYKSPERLQIVTTFFSFTALSLSTIKVSWESRWCFVTFGFGSGVIGGSQDIVLGRRWISRVQLWSQLFYTQAAFSAGCLGLISMCKVILQLCKPKQMSVLRECIWLLKEPFPSLFLHSFFILKDLLNRKGLERAIQCVWPHYCEATHPWERVAPNKCWNLFGNVFNTRMVFFPSL